MTEKRYKYVRDDECIYDNGEKFTHIDMCAYANAETIVNRLNEQHETIRTLDIAITKILQTIKDDKESHAMIMCVEVLKKLEENGFDLE